MKKYSLTTKQHVFSLSPFVVYACLVVCVFTIGCASKEMTEPTMSTEPAVSLLITPTETLTTGDPVELNVIGYDASGNQTSTVGTLEWVKTGLTGTLQDSRFTPDVNAGAHAGTVTAQSGEMNATARIRVIPPLPWTQDFESVELEKIPTHWIGATGKFFVREMD